MRREDWPERLVAYIDARAAEPFAWGHNDCVTFAADWVVEATGVDPIPDYRKPYGEVSANRALRKLGGIADATSARLTEKPPSFAMRGDIGLIEIEGRASLVIVDGDTVVGPGPNGIERVHRSLLVKAWEV